MMELLDKKNVLKENLKNVVRWKNVINLVQGDWKMQKGIMKDKQKIWRQKALIDKNDHLCQRRQGVKSQRVNKLWESIGLHKRNK